MSDTRDRLLTNAGGLLIAAGAVGAFSGGSYGLAAQRPGLVISAVVLLMGYGVVGYLLMNRGDRYFHFILPAAAILVVATLILFQASMGAFLDDEVFVYVLEPAMTLLLVFAGGALLTHVVETMTARVAWPSRGAKSLNTLLHLAAFPPIWCAFTLIDMLGAPSAAQRLLIVGGSALVGIACVVGGYAAARQSHPAFTLLGSALGFLTAASYLVQFMVGNAVFRDEAAFGQFVALIGLIVTALPAAIAAVAWIQIGHEPPAPADEAAAASKEA